MINRMLDHISLGEFSPWKKCRKLVFEISLVNLLLGEGQLKALLMRGIIIC